ncbi:unnamed protein product [Cuscuta epithymum]|uniref:BHLH domain-containing protein n=1 Tax=Cuscuta epithymum TaxID=186058 RepID=A0AAV0FW85_9ASTE|nr:unnamed protein product [Cuscuta epithymum]CAH9139897.1 unnamed protein product [Cuscuta epithymum]
MGEFNIGVALHNLNEHGMMSFSSPGFEEMNSPNHQRAPFQCFNSGIQIPIGDQPSPLFFSLDDESAAAGGTSHGCAINVNSIQESEAVFITNNPPYPIKSYGRRKRRRSNEKGGDGKPKEVVHVRAKRGQATDSHSLAERQRREKINEKLKSLQGLVPGCYKTMGMAVMLDVIINYIRSLQNQIDFLSMKLSAASLFYDFNTSDMDAMDIIHQGTNMYETQEMGKAIVNGLTF